MTKDIVLELQNNRYYLTTQTLPLRQRSLASATLFYVVFCVMDFLRFPSELYLLTLPIRMVFFLMPLSILAIVFLRKEPGNQNSHTGWLIYLYISAGFIHSFLLYTVSKYDIPFLDSGFILIILYGCLLIGLPVILAGMASLVVMSGFVVAMGMSGYELTEIIFNTVVYSFFALLCLAVNHVCVSILSENFRLIKRLYKETVYDGMTGLHNRTYLDEQLGILLQIGDRDDRGIGLAFLDVDKFKHFNDNYGHQKADEALISLSSILKVICRREGDFAARYGGDEFVLVFYDIDDETLQERCEALIASVKALNIPHKYSTVSEVLTISAGAVIINPHSHTTVESALKLADKNLYRAKEKGRDGYHFK